MDFDIETFFEGHGVSFEQISKSEKVKTLGRWSEEFPSLSERSPEWGRRDCANGDSAWQEYSEISELEFFVLPEGHFPCYRCSSQSAPDLRRLADDDYTGCNQVVLVDADFDWSVVFVNHMTEVGCYFQRQGA